MLGPGTVDHSGAVLFVGRKEEDAAAETCALTAVRLTDQLFQRVRVKIQAEINRSGNQKMLRMKE